MEVIECPKCGEKFEPNEKYWVAKREYDQLKKKYISNEIGAGIAVGILAIILITDLILKWI